MEEKQLGGARVFASHYQLVVCDDPTATVGDDDNWTDEKVALGFAGRPTFRMVGTEAHLNDHWVEFVRASYPPSFAEWQRITCVHFRSTNGKVHVMSVIDSEPKISADVEPGDYAVYFAGQNIGIDQSSLGERSRLTDDEIAARKDIEWYRIFIVPGKPDREGRVVDRPLPVE
jgi:hypothetical protein